MTAYRVLPALAGLAVFIFLSALYLSGNSSWYTSILTHWGVVPFQFPFLDLHALIASWECKRLDIDVFERNPCDAIERPFDYSALLMMGSPIPLGFGSTAIVGWILDLLFFLSLVFLPPVQRSWELLLMILASLSTMVVFATERANLDIVIFMLVLGAGFLSLRSPLVRLLAYPIALFAALFLKYYPITLMILSFRERISVFLAVNTAAVCLVAIFTLAYFHDFERAFALFTPASYYTDLFGAKNLPLGIASGLHFPPVNFGFSGLFFYLTAGSIYALVLLTGARICWRVIKNGGLRFAFSNLAPRETIFMVIGSVLIVGCFFTAQSTSYRGIFLLYVIPGLLAIARNAKSRSVRALGVWTVAAIVFIMWGECFRQNLLLAYFHPESGETGILMLVTRFWLLREFAWWWVVSILTAVLLEFLWESQTVRTLMSAFERRGVPSHGSMPE